MTVELERLESKFAKAGEASDRDLDLYQRSAGNLRRLLQTLGLERLQRDVTPSFGDLLRADAINQQREQAERSERQRQEFEKRQAQQSTVTEQE
jgi:hypothetical protein